MPTRFGLGWKVVGLAIGSRAIVPVAARLATGSWAPLEPLIHWDAVHYVRAATQGYTAPSQFFPGFPLVVRGAATLGLSPAAAALLMANVFFVAGVWAAAQWAARRGGEAAGLNLALLLSFFPTTIFFSAAYPESLLLLLSALVFLLAARRTWLASALAAVASATRPSGMFLSLVVLVSGPTRPLWQRIAQAGVSLAGLAAWCAWNAVVWRNPLAWIAAEQQAHRFLHMTSVPAWVLLPLWQITQRSTYVLVSAWNGTFLDPVTAVVAVALLPVLYAKRRWPELLYVAPSVLAPLLGGAVGHRTAGFARYVLVLFPLLYLGAEEIGTSGWARLLAVAIMALLALWGATLFAQGQFLG